VDFHAGGKTNRRKKSVRGGVTETLRVHEHPRSPKKHRKNLDGGQGTSGRQWPAGGVINNTRRAKREEKNFSRGGRKGLSSTQPKMCFKEKMKGEVNLGKKRGSLCVIGTRKKHKVGKKNNSGRNTLWP